MHFMGTSRAIPVTVSVLVVTQSLKTVPNAKEISWDVRMHWTKSSRAQTFPERSLYCKVNRLLVQILLMSVEMPLAI
jgi:hypothetical protein